MIEDFIPDAIQLSSRYMYLIMIKAACEYLLEFNEEAYSQKLEL